MNKLKHRLKVISAITMFGIALGLFLYNIDSVRASFSSDNASLFIGDTLSAYTFSVTTTAPLDNQDVIKFSFPNILGVNSGSYDLSGTNIVDSSGMSLYNSFTSVGLNMLGDSGMNPSLEGDAIANWDPSVVGVGSSVTTSTAEKMNGLQSVVLTSVVSGYAFIAPDSNLDTDIGDPYMVSLQAKGVTGTEKIRFLISSGVECGSDEEYYNFVSTTWDCVESGPALFADGSVYNFSPAVSNTFAGYGIPFTATSSMVITIATTEGDVVFVDNVQVEAGGMVNPFDLGLTTPATEGISSEGVVLWGYIENLSNMFGNSSFEDGTNDWNIFEAAGAYAVTTTEFQFGNNSLYMSIPSGNGPEMIQYASDFTADVTSTLSFYAKGVNGNDRVRFRMVGDDCGGANDAYVYNFASTTWECINGLSIPYSATSTYYNDVTTTADWARYSTNFVPTADTAEISFLFTVGGDGIYDGEAFYIDAIQAEPSVISSYNDGDSFPSSTPFSLNLGGIFNPVVGYGPNSSNLTIRMDAGTPTGAGNPAGDLVDGGKMSAIVNVDLIRQGGAMVSDSNFQFAPSTYATGTLASYTISFTSTSSLPAGSKIHVNFSDQGAFDLTNAEIVKANDINGGANTTTVSSAASSTAYTLNRMVIITAGDTINAGEVVTVVIDNVLNPTTAGVYQDMYVFTTNNQDGLIDGDYFNTQGNFYSESMPPNSDIHIGGTNTVTVNVTKDSGTSTIPLSGGDLTQIKLDGGNMDKGYRLGDQWLNASSSVTYSNILDGSYMFGAMPFDRGNTSFFNNFLPPGMANVDVYNGDTKTINLNFGVPDSVVTIPVSGGVENEFAMIRGYDSGGKFETFAEGTFDSNGEATFNLKVKSGNTWNFSLESGQFGNKENFETIGGAKKWPPNIKSVYVPDSTTTTMATSTYVDADRTLNITLKNSGNDSTISSSYCVGVRRTGGGLFMPPQDVICSANSGSNYQFKVPEGGVSIEVMSNGHGKPTSYAVAINSSTVNKTIYLSSPDNYINVLVQDNESVAVSNATVYANGNNGHSKGLTNSSGIATLYVSPGTYSVGGFVNGGGNLEPNTGVVVADGTNPTSTLTINMGSLKTITGTVTAGGTGVSGVKISARRTDIDRAGNMTETNSDGSYTLRVPAGVYSIGGWSPNTGGLQNQNVDVSSSNQSGIDWTLGGQGTLRILFQNASTLDPLYAGAFNASTGRGNGTNGWTTSGTSKYADITLSAGVYNLRGGSPQIGEIIGDGETATIISGQTTSKTYNAQSSVTMVTLTGNVSSGGSGVGQAGVWASRKAGPGFYSTQTDSNGDYTLNLPDARDYFVGVKELGYIASSGDEEVAVSGNTTQDFTLISAASTITGTVYNQSSTALSNGFVRARKTVNGNEVWTGVEVQANGSYSLTVDSGTWTLFTDSPCYYASTGTTAVAGDSGKNITLSAISGCSLNTPQVHGVAAASGGQVTKGDLILDIPANALGTTQSTVSVSVSDTDLVVASENATPINNAVKTISATDGDGQVVSSLNGNVSISITYDEDDLPVGFDEQELQLGYWDTSSNQWESIAATVDEENNKLSAQLSHFTDIGPILPGVPSAPANLSVSNSTGEQLDLSWNASASADYYMIYATTTETGTFYAGDLLATTTAVSYSHSSLTEGDVWYYEVAGSNENGEGINSDTTSSTVSAAAEEEEEEVVVPVSSGGGSAPVSTVPPVLGSTPVVVIGGSSVTSQIITLTLDATNATSYAISENENFSGASWLDYSSSVKYTLSSGNGEKKIYIKFRSSDGGTTAIKTFTTILSGVETKKEEVKEELKKEETKSEVETKIKYKFSGQLTIGSQGTEVTELQKLLKELGYFTYPSITGYFGPVTKEAVVKFQKANGIEQIGYVETKTRGKLNSNSKNITTVVKESIKTTPSGITFIKYLTIGNDNDDVKKLQLKLKELGHFTYPTATGYYGNITKTAVMSYQKAKGLTQSGVLDENTRNSLNGTTTITATPTKTAEKAKSGFNFTKYLYLGDSGEEVKQLQLKLKTLGYFNFAGGATGYFGDVTKQAVTAFQKAKNLSPFPGWVGPGTREMLNK